MSKLKVCSVFGTRPEAIKMAPVVLELMSRENCEHRLIVTGQHRAMLDQMLVLFGLKPDYDLNIKLARQTLTQITTRALEGMMETLADAKPDVLLVHGDTSTSFVGALAGYYS
jgi:UDP-N-acetylglucosamine 2-epimerase (non-hydrolysing)